jgi:anti-sigma regulatory factor (Ser/Thr protein kinase)
MVRRTCIGWRFAALCDDAEAVASELVTNAVRYARTAIEVTLRRRRTGFQLEVADGNPETPRLPGPPDPLAEGGRGVLLVEALTNSWTVEPGPSGKRVCARFCA